MDIGSVLKEYVFPLSNLIAASAIAIFTWRYVRYTKAINNMEILKFLTLQIHETTNSMYKYYGKIMELFKGFISEINEDGEVTFIIDDPDKQRIYEGMYSFHMVDKKIFDDCVNLRKEIMAKIDREFQLCGKFEKIYK